MFLKNDILKTFAKFTTKHLCRSFYFDKLAGLQYKDSGDSSTVFFSKFCEIFKISYFVEYLSKAASVGVSL